jgi:hypothetical protein
LHASKFGGGIFGEDLREGIDFGVQLSVVGEKIVGLQDILASEGIEPRGDSEAVVVLQGGPSTG